MSLAMVLGGLPAIPVLAADGDANGSQEPADPGPPPPARIDGPGEPTTGVTKLKTRKGQLAQVSPGASVTKTRLEERANVGSAKPSRASGSTIVIDQRALFPDTTVDISPGEVTFDSGSGTDQTTDGTGNAASFKDMSGAAAAGSDVYVMTEGAIRKVSTGGVVTTLAGSATQAGCVQSSNPNDVRFSINPGQIDTDGTYLYVNDPGCGKLLKVSLATGATSVVADGSTTVTDRSLVYGVDPSDGLGYLFWGQGRRIWQLDASTGTQAELYLIPNTNVDQITGLAADAQYLWALAGTGCTTGGGGCDTTLYRINLTSGAVTTFSHASGSMSGTGQLASAGDYLYVSSDGDTWLERITKAGGALTQIAGTNAPGYQEATGTDAWFSEVTGLASDGSSLWVADSGNFRLRKVVDDTPLPSELSPFATSTVDLYPGKVSTYAGAPAGFADMSGVTVVGDHAYVMTDGSIRRVDLTDDQAPVTYLAGDASQTGCVQSADPDAVRFSGSPGQIDSDGYYLYVSDPGCGKLLRVSLATGATSIVADGPSAATDHALAYGTAPSDGMSYLYWGQGRRIWQVDPINGTQTELYLIPITNVDQITGIAVDDQYLWALAGTNCTTGGSCDTTLYRIDLTTGAVTTYSHPDGSISGKGQLVSAGNYLYASAKGDVGVIRFRKSTGSFGKLAGGAAGDTDDEWLNAKFTQVTGLASDGKDLWVADSGVHKLKRVRFAAELARAISPGSTSDAAVPHAMRADPVNTMIGSFTWQATDVVYPGIGIPFSFTRTYNSLSADGGRLGNGWLDPFAASVEEEEASGDAKVHMPSGQTLKFTGQNHAPDVGVFSVLTVDSYDWVLTQRDGTVYRFDPSGTLKSITDRTGRSLTMYWVSGRLEYIIDALGRTFDLQYLSPTSQLLQRVLLPDGRDIEFTYSGTLLHEVVDLRGYTTVYSYTDNKLTTITDQENGTVVTNLYDANNGSIWKQTQANRATVEFFLAGSDGVSTTSNGRTYPGGLPFPPWEDDYDNGQLVGSMQPPNSSSGPRPETTFTYDENGLPATITDESRGTTWTYDYDDAGNLIQVVPPAPFSGDDLFYTYNSFGQVTTFTDAEAQVTRYVYDAEGKLECEILTTSTQTTCSAAQTKDKIVYTYWASTDLTPTAPSSSPRRRGVTYPPLIGNASPRPRLRSA